MTASPRAGLGGKTADKRGDNLLIARRAIGAGTLPQQPAAAQRHDDQNHDDDGNPHDSSVFLFFLQLTCSSIPWLFETWQNSTPLPNPTNFRPKGLDLTIQAEQTGII